MIRSLILNKYVINTFLAKNLVRSFQTALNITNIQSNWAFLHKEEQLKKNTLVLVSQKYSTKKAKGGSKTQKPKVELRNEEINSIINYKQFLDGMTDAIEKLKKDYNETIKLQILPSSFEELNIKTPGGVMKLGEIAQCEQKSPTLYTIDLIASPECVKPVFDAIIQSKLHNNPQIDSTTISMHMSKITKEHRENLAKIVKEKCEQALKKMREIENKALRKVKESKEGNADLRYNVSQHLTYKFELFSKEAISLKEAKIKEIQS